MHYFIMGRHNRVLLARNEMCIYESVEDTGNRNESEEPTSFLDSSGIR